MSKKKVLSKFTILCWAAFTAILGRMQPKGRRLDPLLADCVFSSNIYNVQGKTAILNTCRISGQSPYTSGLAVQWSHLHCKTLKTAIPSPHPWLMTSEPLEVGSGTNSFKTPQVISIESQSSKLLSERKATCCPLAEPFGLVFEFASSMDSLRNNV